ncbi:host attachment family protein [Qipengyuania zhejiangensis]|uniref:host attachment family protein n=1 Tax=Qipengyuania zhejiangensis TaxID=3077782 RepID=UPI002D798345|nr:host attachment family protein [Qipengyuania sp. Z2]
MLLPRGMIVLVVDGARMLLLRNRGDATAPDLKVIDHRQYEPLPAHELASDAPGISFTSGTPGRNTYDDGDPHGSEEARFISAAADALDKAIEDEPNDVVVIAAPPSLGILRTTYTPRIRSALKAELDKDLTQLPVADITQRLVDFE